MSVNISKYVNSYEFDYTLPGSNEVIKFKPVTTGQLKKLIIYENETDKTIVELALDGLIEGCVISEGFDINKLYLEDRFALLIEIRKKSKGEEYSFIYRCPQCEVEFPKTIDLNTLKTTKKKPGEPFKVSDNLSFDFDHITRGEQKEIVNIINSKNITNEVMKNVEMATYAYAYSMKMFHTPEGSTTDVDLDSKIDLLDNALTEKQYKDYIKWFENNTFGIDFRFDLECECGYKSKLNIPLNNFFA